VAVNDIDEAGTMSLRQKVLLALVIPTLLLAAVGIVGVSSLHRLSRSARDILSDNYRTIQDARRMERALRAIESLLQSNGFSAAAPSPVSQQAQAFEEALIGCEGNITEAGESDILKSVRATWEELETRLDAGGTGTNEPAHDPVTMKMVFSIFQQIDDLIDTNEKGMFARERRTLLSARWAVGLMATSLLSALLVLVVFAQVAARRIARPIQEVAENLHDTLKTTTLADDGSTRPGDEIKRLRTELDNLLKRLALHKDEEASRFMRLQERLALVVEEVQEGLILTDESLEVLVMNKRGRELLGVEGGAVPGENLRQMPLKEAVRKALLPIFEEPQSAKRDLAEFKIESQGAERVYRPRILPVTSDDDGRANGYLMVFWDVTEERRFEESRRSFIAMLSHQLKTPVTSLAMSVSLLWERFHGRAPEGDELLSIAKDDCLALSNLVNELVDAARDVTSNLALRLRRLDLASLLREALRPLAPLAREREIDLRDAMGAQPVFVLADPVKLPWVVTNIVGNALRYTPAGGVVRIALGVERGIVSIVISDTGAGIARDDIKQIFLPFASVRRDPRPGLHGLGLAIAREIIEAHQGSIDVESELGRGTTFTIRFPIAAGAAP